MGLAWYISTENEVPGLDTFVDGTSIAHASEGKMATIVKKLGIRQLMDFFSTSREEVEDLIGEPLNVDSMAQVPDEEWFPAEAGLDTVKPLLAYLRENEGELEHQEDVIRDLEGFERILLDLKEKGVRWHMSIDI